LPRPEVVKKRDSTPPFPRLAASRKKTPEILVRPPRDTAEMSTTVVLPPNFDPAEMTRTDPAIQLPPSDAPDHDVTLSHTHHKVPVVQPAPTEGKAPPPPAPAAEPGPTDSLPGFRFVEYLHKTPLAEVWRVRGGGGERLAQCLSMTAGASPDLAPRLMGLRHPGLLPLEVMTSVNGRVAVLAALNRRTLRERYQECFARGQPGIPRPELLTHMRQTAAVLDHFAERQLYHLGMHPRSVLLEDDRALVADFGLLQLAWLPTGQPIRPLNPRYAAPELAQPGASPAADQYSLALIYAEMLTGVHPYNGPIGQRANGGKRAQARLDLSFLPATDRPIVSRALNPDPRKRFAGCGEFVRALEVAAGAEASRLREKLLQLPPVVHHARLHGQTPKPAPRVPAVKDLVPALISAAAGALRVLDYNTFRYLLHPGNVLEHRCHLRLFTGGLRLKVLGLHEEWKGAVVDQDEVSFTYHMFGPRSLWQLCVGNRAGLEVRVSLEADARDVQMYQAVIRVAPLNGGGAAQRLAVEVGPAVISSVRMHLQAVPELRAQERWEYDQPVRVYPVQPDLTPGKVLDGTALDLALGGLGFLVPAEPPTELAYLQLSPTPPLADFAILARLVSRKQRSDGYEIGAAFVGAEEAVKA
jgi:hypothetical protein